MRLRILDQIAAMLEQRAAEARAGITAIEAIAVDEFETQLRALTTSEHERASVRRMAIALLMTGVREHEIEPMVRNWHVMVPRVDYELEQLKHRIGSIQSTLRPADDDSGEQG